MWLIILSDQLPVLGLVGFYPTNYLMGRGLILWRQASEEGPIFARVTFVTWSYPVLARVSSGYPKP